MVSVDDYSEVKDCIYNGQNSLARYHADCNDDGDRFTVEARLTWEGGKTV